MNFREGHPIYLQIAERLMDEIMADRYKADERVPGVRDYSVLLQVNVNTTVKAFDTLVQRGILYNKRGLGSFVTPQAKDIIHAARREEIFSRHLTDLATKMKQLDIPLSKVTEHLQRLLHSSIANPLSTIPS